MRPQRPAVIGQEKLVPLTAAYEVSPAFDVVKTLTPGATKSTSEPRFEKVARTSF
jgi:hypothetical protein